MSPMPARAGLGVPAGVLHDHQVWRGCDLGPPAAAVLTSGHADLDAELPGGGWPTRALTEILAPQPSLVEWRLLAPSLRAIATADRPAVLVGPPKVPHLPGLLHEGMGPAQLVWIQADTPAERLWCTEQLLRARSSGAVLAWLPQARPDQIRRLQVAAGAFPGPTFLFRPEAARHEASAAPLRVCAALRGEDWALQVEILKRRGPAHDEALVVPSSPGGLAEVLPGRLRPQGLDVLGGRHAALGGSVVPLRPRRAAA